MKSFRSASEGTQPEDFCRRCITWDSETETLKKEALTAHDFRVLFFLSHPEFSP